jgi:hypothetical protein
MRAWQVVEHGEPEAVMKLGEKPVPQPGPGPARRRHRNNCLPRDQVEKRRGPMTLARAHR